MIKFSHSYDIKSIDERYKELFELKRYNKAFCDFIKQMFAK